MSSDFRSSTCKTLLRNPPVVLKVFVVATGVGVGAILLQKVERLFGIFKAALVSRGGRIFRQRVDGEALPIDELRGVERRPVTGCPPEPSAVFVIPEMPDEEVDPLRRCCAEVRLRRVRSVERGEAPDHPGLGHDVFVGLRPHAAIRVDVHQVSSVPDVQAVAEPELDDASLKVEGDLVPCFFNPLPHRPSRSPSIVTHGLSFC